VARSSVLVTAVGFESEHAVLLVELAARCPADETQFKGNFNLWLHFDKLDMPTARIEVRRALEKLTDHPEAHFMY
jgi:hypothetical protein